MFLRNTKWKRLATVFSIFMAFVFLFEIVPMFYSISSHLFISIERKLFNGDVDENEKLLLTLQHKKSTISKKIDRLVLNTDRYMGISSIVATIDSLAKVCDVQIIDILPGNVNKSGNLDVQSVSVKMKCSYENFYNFVRFMEHSAKVIRFKEFILESPKNKSKYLSGSIVMDFYLNL
jgi:hypothetical protein